MVLLNSNTTQMRKTISENTLQLLFQTCSEIRMFLWGFVEFWKKDLVCFRSATFIDEWCHRKNICSGNIFRDHLKTAIKKKKASTLVKDLAALALNLDNSLKAASASWFPMAKSSQRC